MWSFRREALCVLLACSPSLGLEPCGDISTHAAEEDGAGEVEEGRVFK